MHLNGLCKPLPGVFRPMAKKLTLLITIAFSIVYTKSYSQITIHEKNVEIQKIFKSIEQQSKFTFLYDSKDIKDVPNITIDVDNASIQDALSQTFKGLSLTYKIIAQTILVKQEPKKPENLPPGPAQQKKGMLFIKGTVMDQNLLPLKDVMIKELKLGFKTLSNAMGDFTIQSGTSGTIVVSAPGFAKQTISYADTTFLEINLQKDGMESIDLSEVQIQRLNEIKANPTKFINMENRNYMNLAQVLQGTIPGLSLQIVNTSVKTVTSVDAYVYRDGNTPVLAFRRFSVEDFLAREGRVQGQKIIDLLLKGSNVPKAITDLYHINTITTVTNVLVPEIRGANNFGSNTSNMLVVIDGFPQDGFPANYPMTNVESIEVIKDPKELIKWGSRAAGGAILIRSKAAKAGRLDINYSANFYYAPAPAYNREKLKLANTATYLEYLNDPGLSLNNGATPFGVSPAKQLVSQKRLNQITQAQFQTQWDSLARLDNESQVNMLQQNSFTQNHGLTVSGGTKAYKFTGMANYITGQDNSLGSKKSEYTFGLNNNFSLLKNKLNIRWLVNFSDAKNKSGYTLSPTNLGIDPYQMLLDDRGNYVYDYTVLSADANKKIVGLGYKDYGVNLLQDARINDLSSRVINKQSNLNLSWQLLPGLSFATSFLYKHRNTNNRTLYAAESSYSRQLVDRYGQLSSKGVNFYVPYGDILQESDRIYEELNLRSALSYSKVFGKHSIGVTLGGGAAAVSSSSPANTALYGYNSSTKTSTPVYLPTYPSTNAAITNFYSLFAGASSTMYPNGLTQPLSGDTSVNRNLNGNLSLMYGFANRISVSGSYLNVLNPLYGQSAKYSTQKSYSGDVTGRIVKDWNSVLKDVLISVGTTGIKMPDLPAQYSNRRYLQTYFNNYTIWVNGATPTQQQGQSSKLIYQKLALALADSSLVINGAYNTQTNQGNLETNNTVNAKSNETRKLNYLSGGLDLFLRKKLLNFHLNYGRSPEGESQYNGSFNYNIARESYFKSNTINDLEVSALLQDISAYQGFSIMTATNIATGGSFSQATNSDFSQLPAASKIFELHGKIGLVDNKYSMDLRYYDQNSAGVSNNLSVLTDPSTGLSTQVSYSSITNRGIELFMNANLVKTNNFNYNITLNGALNRNIAKNVPITRFTATNSYTTVAREGYDVSNIWSTKWAGLNSEGDPQIYDKNGNITATIDSATIASSLFYQGVTKAPYTGGLIQEVRVKQFFARVALTFNLGYVMRYYLPYPGYDGENSSLIADRWRNPGDEQRTDVPKISSSGSNSYREFVTRYSSNGILPADNIRLQEVMLGFSLPNNYLKKYGLSYFVMTFQVQNLAYWAKNKYKIDPATISQDGRIGSPLAKIYSCNISVNF
ncbi:SusC/RagA family TonB-linked outer membrane protein [Pedobacter sp. MC2016-24]|uniref:SusC/RagA family TonB-linked outer membrane protein n=1 Tax=Pedobacter sp. MC2016-24 TaxID=2780090 RepID=UPI001882CB61|nr:SusC/RagA family TonB-linked outer membrane protein [Pedobacter sp. MC2016-24]MBE9599425.1 TonB-dependent receptor plug domain-containing protein [Pedobacter sp. MC2016-24]